MGQGPQRVSRTGSGVGRTIAGLPDDVTLQPDAKAFAGAIGGGGFGARRSVLSGRQAPGAGGTSGAAGFSGITGLGYIATGVA